MQQAGKPGKQGNSRGTHGGGWTIRSDLADVASSSRTGWANAPILAARPSTSQGRAAMRTFMLAAMMAGLLTTASSLVASEGCGCNAAGSACGNCDPCDCCDGGDCGGRHGCGLFGDKCGCPIDGLNRFANCGCNGSYNYPVPPLYTY